jgi:type VI secretion system secreted protein Hcp
VSKVTFGYAIPANIGSATGGAGAGKATFDDLTVTVPWSSTNVNVFNTLVKGAHYPWAVLTIAKPGGATGGSPTIIERDSFRLVFPTKLANTSSGDETQLTFQYGAVEIRATSLTPSGGPGTTVVGTWNRVTNGPGLDFP